MSDNVKVSTLVAQTLAKLGVGHVFGVVGSGNFDVTNILVQAGVPYTLRLLRQVDGAWTIGKAMPVGSAAKSAKGETAKAETVVILAESAEKLTVLVLYDNVDEAAPTRHEIILKS